MITQHDAQHGDQDQQQREDRREGVVGHQGGQIARLVIAKLLPHGDRERQPAEPLLDPVGALDGLLCWVHRADRRTQTRGIHPGGGPYRLMAISWGRWQSWPEGDGEGDGPAPAGVDVADGPALAGGPEPGGLGSDAGASLAQSATITVPPSGSALPPMPLMSTK